MQKVQKSQSGFTLIELVVVIVILGILAATALPKFIDLSTDARAGVMRGVESSMRGADTMVYAKSAAKGTATAATGSVSINGVPVDTVYGYAKDAATLKTLLALNPASDFDIADDVIYHAKSKGALASTPAPKTCGVKYTPATDTAEPKYEADISGC